MLKLLLVEWIEKYKYNHIKHKLLYIETVSKSTQQRKKTKKKILLMLWRFYRADIGTGFIRTFSQK